MTTNECCRCREMHECPERNADWHWTVEGERASRGRWTVERPDADYIHISHADIPAEGWTYDLSAHRWDRNTPDAIRAQGRDFLTWQAAQAPTFTPQPLPEVGQYGRFELRSGDTLEGDVTYVSATPKHTALGIAGEFGYYINTSPDALIDPDDIIAWHPIARPVPEEPKGLGAVVEVAGVEYVRRSRNTSYPWASDKAIFVDAWSRLIARGPVTVLSEGVQL